MWKKAFIVFIGLVVLAGIALWHLGTSMSRSRQEPAAIPDPHTLRRIAQGELIGFADEQGTYSWRGIPYTQPPVGPLRWRAPQRPAAWHGTLQALRFGSMCPQIGSFVNESAPPDYGHVVGNEDCLTLNIWAPRSPTAGASDNSDHLPVMVWIHGGGNINGASSMYAFVRNLSGQQNLVMVSVNYRLGILGWLHHPAFDTDGSTAEDRSGNYGTLDIIQALRWVHENISAFGGDPRRVTVFGESAGGFDVYSLLVTPLAHGLFQGAIAESGSTHSASLSDTENYRDDTVAGHERSAREILNELLIRDGKAKSRKEAKILQEGMSPQQIRDYLRAQPVTDLLATVAEPGNKMLATPAIFRDGYVIPKDDPNQLFKDPARYNAVPFITGTNHDEMRLFNLFDPELTEKRLGFIPWIRDPAQFDRDSRYGSDNWIAAATDEPLTIMSASGRHDVFGYRFDWHGLPDLYVVDFGKLFGATHGMEVNFVFNVLDNNGMVGTFYNKHSLPDRIALAHAMSSYWAEFAYERTPGRGRGGDLPEWTAWVGNRPEYMIFDHSKGLGLRMGIQAPSKQSIKDKLLEDRASGTIPTQREFCRLYAQLFLYARVRSDYDTLEDYNGFGREGCAAYPPEQFKPRTTF